MDIHTRQLRYFMELAQCLNFTKAAMNLYIAQPALSQQIAELEKQLGVTLFVRNSRSVSLTPAGRLLMESCPDILASLEKVHKQLLQAQAGIRGSLRIGYLDAFRHRLPGLLRAFSQLYPDVSIELFNGTLRELKAFLDAGNIDVAFLSLNYLDMDKENSPESHVLWRDDLCLAVREDHPFVTAGCEDFSLLEDEDLLVLDDNNTPAFSLVAQNACGEIGLAIKKIRTIQSVGTVLIEVDAGRGISLLPYSAINMAPKQTRFIPVKKQCMEFGVVWKADSGNASVPLFLDILQNLENSAGEKED